MNKLMIWSFFLGRLGKLGFKINGGRDRPVVPGDPGIFVTTVKRGSVLDKVIGPGDKILKVLHMLRISDQFYGFTVDHLTDCGSHIMILLIWYQVNVDKLYFVS